MKKLMQVTLLVVFMAGLLLSSCSEQDESPDQFTIDQNASLIDARMTDPEDSTYDPFKN